jgi:hypothetical protein
MNHKTSNIRCVSSGGTWNDSIETNIHCDLQIQWMIRSRLNIHCDSLTVYSSNDSMRFCKINRPCIELNRLTDV